MSIDISEFKQRKVHFLNSGVKELRRMDTLSERGEGGRGGAQNSCQIVLPLFRRGVY